MNKRIAIFHGGKISQHLMLIKEAAKKMEVAVDLISYNDVNFETNGGVKINIKNKNIDDYGVFFFRTTGQHWEEVNLIMEAAKEKVENGEIKVVDPLILKGRPADACKAWQMVQLKKAGIGVPKTVYGSLFYLKNIGIKNFQFPVILKGSGGDRGTRVYLAKNQRELEDLVVTLRRSEIDEGRRYMLQEFVGNEGDYRLLILGEKVLGVMKRSRQDKNEYRNNFSMGGKVEVVDLPEEVKRVAVEATKVCGLMVAGVDVIMKDSKPLILEVNKGPQFWGFMQATGIDVPMEIVKFLKLQIS